MGYLTSTYAQDEPGEHKGFEYSRTHNPTRFALEANLAALEGGEARPRFASGLAATRRCSTCSTPGDHVVARDDVYGGTFRLFDKVFTPPRASSSRYVDMTDAGGRRGGDPPDDEARVDRDADEPDAQARRHRGGRRRSRKKRGRSLLVVDNTFMTPFFQRPLELGADVVVHSTTKYLNGHSDVVGGAIVDERRRARASASRSSRTRSGAVPAPMDCFLVLRGTKTLHVRMERHEENARDDRRAGSRRTRRSRRSSTRASSRTRSTRSRSAR